ncbi:RING-H2 finger protein ATL7-like [Morus notabilis]|uniref:RING-H2 finger protein ATL7-like n=1 Tax=Morus notabilis TaxID=981085 RepID=UPI000CED6320|nr:RING-H2 finger protein ATL7-like [Morus notabilis]
MSYNNNLDPPRTNSTPTLSTSASSSSSSQVKVYQFFMFCVPIFFTFLLLFLFYLFYLRPRRLNWSSLRMPTSSTLNFDHFLPTIESSGLNKELREMLPIIVYKESFSVRDTQCSVCLGDYEADDRLQQIPACGHTFHIDCIDHWLATHTTCPLCRLSLLSYAKSPAESSNIQVGNTLGPSVAENDGESSLQQSPEPCEQVAELRTRDAMHNSGEENAGRSHCVDCEREQSECKGQAINA